MNEYIAITYQTPVDEIEPLEINDYRECSLRYLRVMSLAMSFIQTADDPVAASVGVSFALGLVSVVGNRSMSDFAREYGICRATISHYAKRFSRMADLPPSPLMKTQDKVDKARDARIRNLEP